VQNEHLLRRAISAHSDPAHAQFPLYEGAKKKWSQWQGYQVSAFQVRPVCLAAEHPPIRAESWCVAQASLCGSAAGGFSAAVTTPLDVVKTRLMLGADAEGVKYKGTMDAIRRINAEGGAGRFFAGVGPRTMWISIGGCVFFGAYESSKNFLATIL